MSRSARESSFSFVLGCGMHAPPPLHAGLNADTAIFTGPVKVLADGVAKLTWNRHRFRLLVPKLRKSPGEPAGGAVLPSRSAGSNPPKLELNCEHCCVATLPASMLARSNAQTLEPAKLDPLLKML